MNDILSDTDSLSIELSLETPEWETLFPNAETRLTAALQHAWRRLGPTLDRAPGELCLVLGDDSRSQALNAEFRGQDKPTNVLSFSDDADVFPGAPARLGDLYLALGVSRREAEEMNISLADHSVHLAVHGLLHLLGFDHQTDDEATIMEDWERDILGELGIADPYGSADGSDDGREHGTGAGRHE